MRLSLLDLTLTPEERDEITLNPNFLDELFETPPLQQQQQQQQQQEGELIKLPDEAIGDFVRTYYEESEKNNNNENTDHNIPGQAQENINCNDVPPAHTLAATGAEYAYLRKCGEVIVDGECFWLNCIFCPGVCLQFEVFVQHIREQHGQDIQAFEATTTATTTEATTTTTEPPQLPTTRPAAAGATTTNATDSACINHNNNNATQVLFKIDKTHEDNHNNNNEYIVVSFGESTVESPIRIAATVKTTARTPAPAPPPSLTVKPTTIDLPAAIITNIRELDDASEMVNIIDWPAASAGKPQGQQQQQQLMKTRTKLARGAAGTTTTAGTPTPAKKAKTTTTTIDMPTTMAMRARTTTSATTTTTTMSSTTKTRKRRRNAACGLSAGGGGVVGAGTTIKTLRTRSIVSTCDEGGDEETDNEKDDGRGALGATRAATARRGKRTCVGVGGNNNNTLKSLTAPMTPNGHYNNNNTSPTNTRAHRNNNNNACRNSSNDRYDGGNLGAFPIDKVNNRPETCVTAFGGGGTTNTNNKPRRCPRRRRRRRRRWPAAATFMAADKDSNSEQSEEQEPENVWLDGGTTTTTITITTTAAIGGTPPRTRTRATMKNAQRKEQETQCQQSEDEDEEVDEDDQLHLSGRAARQVATTPPPPSPPPSPLPPPSSPQREAVDLVFIMEDANSTALRHEMAILDDGVEETVDPYSVMFNARPQAERTATTTNISALTTPTPTRMRTTANNMPLADFEGVSLSAAASANEAAIDWHAPDQQEANSEAAAQPVKAKKTLNKQRPKAAGNATQTLTSSQRREILRDREIIEYLLEAYKNNEKLWNPDHPEYKHNANRQYFSELSAPLLLDMNSNLSGGDIYAILSKLTANYRKELRKCNKKARVKNPSRIWYFEKLEFLRKTIKTTESKEPPPEEDSADSRENSLNLENIQMDPEDMPMEDMDIPKAKYTFLKSEPITFATTNEQLSFIEIYRDYDILWDVEHPDYRSALYRDKALQDLLTDVNSTFQATHTLDQVKKTIHQMRKTFKARKHKLLADKNSASANNNNNNIPEIHSKLAEFLDLNWGPFQCIDCGKITKTSAQYKIHKSSHDGTTPFVCNLCGRGFQLQGNLTIHIRRHRRDFPYSCGVCEKRFATSTEVSIHMRTHTGERPYICDACGKSFKTWSFFAIHQRVHQEQSNFHCPICERDFYEKNRFTDHMNRHLSVRKHSCEVCQKSFTTMASLRKHFELHEAIKKYECVDCGKRYAQRASLRWHRRRGGCPTPWPAGEQQPGEEEQVED